jgi:PncC family amidohydrolase
MLLHHAIPAIIDGLRDMDLRIAFAESCTGGRLAADLTTVPGASDVVAGSLVCYQLAAKRRLLGLDFVTEQNVVSLQTVKAMALAARLQFATDIAVATTGWLDGEHPEAYWAAAGPIVSEDGIVHVHWDHIEFPKDNPRDFNREIVVRAVMESLEIFAKETT